MILEVLGNPYQYELEKLTRVFFPNEKIRVVFAQGTYPADETVCTAQIEADTARVSIQLDGRNWCKAERLAKEDDRELQLATLLFCGLQALTGYTPQWGLLTGIRPSKLLLTLQAEMGKEAAREYFTDRFFVSPQKNGTHRKRRRTRNGNHRVFAPRVLQFICFHSVLPHAVQLLFVRVARHDKRHRQKIGARLCAAAVRRN